MKEPIPVVFTLEMTGQDVTECIGGIKRRLLKMI